MKLFYILSTILPLWAVTISADEPLLSRSSAIAIDDGNDNNDDGSQRRLQVEEYVSKVRDWVPRRDEGVLPISLTREEEVEMEKFKQQQSATTRSTLRQRATEKKPENPQFVPEWSEMEGVLIAYPLGISVSPPPTRFLLWHCINF